MADDKKTKKDGKRKKADSRSDKKLHRTDTDKDADEDQLEDDTGQDQLVDQLSAENPKVGESSDNLRQRSEWFQKRHGR